MPEYKAVKKGNTARQTCAQYFVLNERQNRAGRGKFKPSSTIFAKNIVSDGRLKTMVKVCSLLKGKAACYRNEAALTAGF